MSDIISIVLVVTAVAIGLSLVVAQLFTGVPTLSTDASQAKDVIELLQAAGLPDHAVIYDLGCGWGALVIALAKAFPNAQVRGIEVSPFPYWVARLRTRTFKNVSLALTDFITADLSDANVIACYLMPAAMPKLAKLLDRTIKPGTKVISLTFWFHDRQFVAARKGMMRGAVALYDWPALSRPNPNGQTLIESKAIT
jgi:hypothetical protein